jgi:phytoene dehydrogenase-like protein
MTETTTETGSNTSFYDAIFIGAGINALGGAILLAEAGWRVLVLEKNDTPGGSVRTQELTLPGFHHDIGAINLNLFVGSPFYQQRKEAFAQKGLRFVTADPSVGSVFEGGRFVGISTNAEKLAQTIAGFSAADVLAWENWTQDFQDCAPHFFQIFSSPAPEKKTDDQPFGDLQDVPAHLQAKIKSLLLDSPRKLLSARFESEEIRAMIAAWGLHLDHSPDIAGGSFFPFLESNIDALQGIFLAEGGSCRLIEAMVDILRDSGGESRSATTVTEIVIENDRATGVLLKSGEVIKASHAVVAGITPSALLKLTNGHLPSPVIRRARNWRYGPGTMMIHLALSDLPDWQAEDARQSFYVHIGPSLDYMDRAYQEGVTGLLPAEPYCVVGQPTLYDPTRAPEGQHVLWIMVRCVPADIKGDAAGEITSHTWSAETRDAFADRVLDRIESYAPGLRQRILAQAVHTPLDLEALNPNLVGGDLCSGSVHLDQFYGQRPFPGHAHQAMPLAGLHMCGASTWPGGGASPGSGVLAAERILFENSNFVSNK